MALPRGLRAELWVVRPRERSLPVGGKLPLTNIGAGTSASSSPRGPQSIGPRQPVASVRQPPMAARSTLARSAFFGTMYGSCECNADTNGADINKSTPARADSLKRELTESLTDADER